MINLVLGIMLMSTIRWLYVEAKYYLYKKEVKFIVSRALYSRYTLNDMWGVLSKLYYL